MRTILKRTNRCFASDELDTIPPIGRNKNDHTLIQFNFKCFYFANKLPKRIVFYYNHEFNIKLLSEYFNSLKTEYSVVVTDNLEEVKHIDEIVFVHSVFEKINWDCEVNYLNTEPLNLECRLWNVINIHNSYPKLKKFYDKL